MGDVLNCFKLVVRLVASGFRVQHVLRVFLYSGLFVASGRRVCACMVVWGVCVASGLKVVVHLVAAGCFGASGFKALVCLVA